ncbi:MAG TPA: Rrf2 family transcriptional regulator [Streptosporangiaceae bacterium]|nr:Rrf2 family transcriptional regulator [Streptosporangiaceae bacterium]
MRLSQGVEWGLHCALLLAQAPDGLAVPRRTLAEHYDLPEAYLAKQLQSLVAAGILHAVSGPRGGYRLARPPAEITVLDVLDAVEGTADPFVCQEIRQRGVIPVTPEQCRRPCAIAAVMTRAHQAWRASLRAVTLAELAGRVPRPVREQQRARFAQLRQSPRRAGGPRSGTAAAGAAGSAHD